MDRHPDGTGAPLVNRAGVILTHAMFAGQPGVRGAGALGVLIC
jgi:hypothetical protein